MDHFRVGSDWRGISWRVLENFRGNTYCPLQGFYEGEIASDNILLEASLDHWPAALAFFAGSFNSMAMAWISVEPMFSEA